MMNLVDTITKMSFTRNEGGDFVYTTQSTMSCRFREINDLNRTSNKEELDCDALVHFKASENVNLGDIFCYDGEYYRVDEIFKARRLSSRAILFKKCALIRHRQIS